MLEGLYSAAAGMAAQQQRMDALANDVANVSTTGYRQDRVGFQDLIYQQAQGGSARAVRTGAGAAALDGGQSLRAGALHETGQPLDLGLEGPGFFAVRQANGTLALTRDGSFHRDAQGQIVAAGGEVVQAVGGGAITIPTGTTTITVAANGTVQADGRPAGRIAVYDVPAPGRLTPVGTSLLVPNAASGPARPATNAIVHQGELEDSDVDLAGTLTDMMDAQRTYAMDSRAIQTQDQMLQIANGIKR